MSDLDRLIPNPFPYALGTREAHRELLERYITLANVDRNNHAKWRDTTVLWTSHLSQMRKQHA